jgi:hypothetical protein
MVKWGIWLLILAIQGCAGWDIDPLEGRITYDIRLKDAQEAVKSCHERHDISRDCRQWERILAEIKGEI